MPSFLLADASDLEQWSARRESQGDLPKLVRALIRASTPTATAMDFPAGDDIIYSGWDGVLDLPTAQEYLPEGPSVWEFGTNQEVTDKATADFKKRTANPLGKVLADTTYVFVTSRRWPGKEKWLSRRTPAGWKEIRVLDASDLEQWMEKQPAVHMWFSKLIGKHITGAATLQSVAEAYLNSPEPALPLALYRAGRDEAVGRVTQWLKGPASRLAIKGETRQEVLIFLAAVLETLPSSEREQLRVRSVVVETPSALELFVGNPSPVIVVPMFEQAVTLRPGASQHWLVPKILEDPPESGELVLPRAGVEAIELVLTENGFPEGQARRLAPQIRRGYAAFRRAHLPIPSRPDWARPPISPALFAALLAGSWDQAQESDLQVLETLAGQPQGEWWARVRELLLCEDPPLQQISSEVSVRNKRDLLFVLPYLTGAVLQRLLEVVLQVLGARDPKWELPEKDQWASGMYGKAPPYSASLREGLADTLAWLGMEGEASLSDGQRAQEYVDLAVSRLLAVLTDWQGWAGLGDVLPLLAEASPEQFLRAVERDLALPEPLLAGLFVARPGMLGPAPTHSSLLWALEGLAWHVSFLPRVALILARLKAFERPSNFANTPLASLKKIFSPWMPQTRASIRERFQVLDGFRRRQRQVAFQVLSAQLPSDPGIQFPSHAPRWRDWALDAPQRVTYGDLETCADEALRRMLEDVGGDADCWGILLRDLRRISSEQAELVVALLEQTEFTDTQRGVVWGLLRGTVADQRDFSDAKWALPVAQVDRLEQVYRQLTPEDPHEAVAWLFEGAPAVPGRHLNDYEGWLTTLHGLRREAVSEVLAQGGWQQILPLVSLAPEAGYVGATLGEVGLDPEPERAFLTEGLLSDTGLN